MSKKEDSLFPFPGDVSGSFDKEDFILNYRPRIDFVEPEQVAEDYTIREEDKQVTPVKLEETRIRTQNVIDGLKSVVALIDIAQARIDQRVNASVAGLGMAGKVGEAGATAEGAGVGVGMTGGAGAGEVATTGQTTSGVVVKLDPVKDAHVVAAMKRRFPEKADPTVITYEDYKQVIDCVHKHAPDVPAVSIADVRAAAANPQKTSFGGYDKLQGQNRPEISSIANSVQPIDLEAFQQGSILALFALLYPLIKMEDKLEILQHIATIPHI